METNKESVGKRIKKIRMDHGWSLELFGEKIETPPVKPGIISRWENGKSLPNNRRIKAIADLGGISVDELLYGTKEEILKNLIDSTYKEFTNENYLFNLQNRPQDFKKLLTKINEKLQYIKRENLINDSERYKNIIESWLEEELYRDERNNYNVIDYLATLMAETVDNLHDFLNDPLTKEAIKKSEIDDKVLSETKAIYNLLIEKRLYYLSLRDKYNNKNSCQ
ncbi:helix-turn-helix domain-containing protein [Aerococcus sp. Group 1]|uniref:helix-turn-helix domain-containing protein n=1 Tax=Aerococcus urinae (strain CCUG 59500 / ACS-120-V-Col10a) TaxID=2976812 RepID=UPI00227D34DB|nr:helix-turn-helix transcriptional regulator [Aerococcus sp. Group 1]MCY3031372.1 helix-turn-helix domain-containing protein [Aerococcus sp. Group 1]